MKFLLTFAIGMTMFSKIAQSEILSSRPDVQKLVVRVPETKGEKKIWNLKKVHEHDKF